MVMLVGNSYYSCHVRILPAETDIYMNQNLKNTLPRGSQLTTSDRVDKDFLQNADKTKMSGSGNRDY